MSDSKLSFAETHAALRAVVTGIFSLKVDAWAHPREPRRDYVSWTAWLADHETHLSANTPELLVERVAAYVASAAPKGPMTPEGVVMGGAEVES